MSEVTTIEQNKMIKVLNLIQLLHKGRMSFSEISTQLGVCERTVYRYINLLEGLDIAVEKDFNDRYFIAQDNCPLCGYNQQHTTNEQPDSMQFDRKEGRRRRDEGIARAVNHANAVDRTWEDMAYDFFVNVLLKHHKGEFQCEDYRAACKGIVPDPPSLRAYGGIITRAKFAGLIVKAGPPRAVKNPKAQMAYSSVWKKS